MIYMNIYTNAMADLPDGLRYGLSTMRNYFQNRGSSKGEAEFIHI